MRNLVALLLRKLEGFEKESLRGGKDSNKRVQEEYEDFLDMGFSFLQNKRRERFLGSFLS